MSSEASPPPLPMETTDNSNTLAYLIVFFTIIGYILMNYLTPSAPPAAKPKTSSEENEDNDPLRNFTLSQLKTFNGTITELMAKAPNPIPSPIYVSINGLVFDVSKSSNFYGPGGSYGVFAGREIGCALGKMCFDACELDDYNNVANLSASERISMDDWIVKFRDDKKYRIVGRLVLDVESEGNKNLKIMTDKAMSNHRGTTPPSPALLAKTLATASSGTALIPLIPSIYLGVGSKIYDVSYGGSSFYSPGSGYALFAGKDASVSLGKMSFKPEDLANKDTTTLSGVERKVLRDWVVTFGAKKMYPVVGSTGNGFDDEGVE